MIRNAELDTHQRALEMAAQPGFHHWGTPEQHAAVESAQAYFAAHASEQGSIEVPANPFPDERLPRTFRPLARLAIIIGNVQTAKMSGLILLATLLFMWFGKEIILAPEDVGVEPSAKSWVILLLGLIFIPTCGAWLVWRGLRDSFHQIRLLRLGQRGLGVRINLTPTGRVLNGKQILTHCYAFYDRDGRLRSIEDETHSETLREQEEVLFDYDKDADGVIVAAIPGLRGIDPQGQVEGRFFAMLVKHFHYFALSGLSVLGILWLLLEEG